MINIFYILFGLSFNYQITFFGQLLFSQIIIIFMSIILFFNQFDRNSLYDYEKKILFLILLWLANQIFSDIINKSAFIDYIRGNAKIIVTFFSFYVFFKLSKLEKFSLIKMLLWIALVKIFFLLVINTNDLSFLQRWKFGFGLFSSIAIIIMSYFYLYKEQFELHGFTLFIVLFIGFLSLAFETRYLFLFNLLFVGYLTLNNYLKIQGKYTLVLSTILMAFVVLTIYQFLIDGNLLPDDLYAKQQAQSGDLGILIGGRGNIFGSLKAIFDAPLFGHGSWAKDCEYTYFKYDVLESFNYNPKLFLARCLIPAHSVIFGSWVTAGFFGGLVWIYLVFKIIKETMTVLKFKNNFYELSLYLFIVCMWDIFFSPYGGARMILLPFYIVTILSISSNYKKKS